MGKRLPLPEFVAMIALLFSLIAFGTDAMLPAFGEIATDLQLADPNKAQLIIGAFVLGTGVGQLIAGPLSDAWGRKPVLGLGILLFILCSFWAGIAGSLESLLVARFIQGLGISAPRSAGQAMVRDLYQGRTMARVVSLAMMLFVVVPAVAPFIGQMIMNTFGWRSIFTAFQLFGLIALAWLFIRQAETHPLEKRRPFQRRVMLEGLKEVVRSRRVVTSIAVLSLTYAVIFAFLSSAQQVFVVWLGAGDRFPLYFACVALVSGTAGGLNAALVERYGMWVLSTLALFAIAALSLGAALVISSGALSGQSLLYFFLFWGTATFFTCGLIFSNVNALAMEPMGHVAGMAAAIVGAASTSFCLIIAVPIGQMFNGTGMPLIIGVGCCAGVGFLVNLTNPRVV
ncbi:MAG: multidrug effflux MFS transporter [Rhodobacteraceae bacterium]|nr:multidrug effflux MFS transporter [Paracoccaceae bacterium]